MIIVDEGASVDYVEGCTAPNYSSDSLHAAVVEVNVCKDAYCRYTTIQNWSDNVYSLETKRAAAAENATMEWVQQIKILKNESQIITAKFCHSSFLDVCKIPAV